MEKDIQRLKEEYRDLEEVTIKYRQALMNIKHWDKDLKSAIEYASKTLEKCQKKNSGNSQAN